MSVWWQISKMASINGTYSNYKEQKDKRTLYEDRTHYALVTHTSQHLKGLRRMLHVYCMMGKSLSKCLSVITATPGYCCHEVLSSQLASSVGGKGEVLTCFGLKGTFITPIHSLLLRTCHLALLTSKRVYVQPRVSVSRYSFSPVDRDFKVIQQSQGLKVCVPDSLLESVCALNSPAP